MSCGCNIITIIPDGGLVVSPEAVVVFENISGGVTCGGSADVDVLNEPYDGIYSVWTLQEIGAGITDEYEDRTRTGNHGTGGQILPQIDSGVFCLLSQYFEGLENNTGSYIDLPSDDLTDFAVSCWIKIDSLYKSRCFYSRGHQEDSSVNVFSLGHSIINHVVGSITTADGNFEVYSERLEQDRWYHVACEYCNDSLSIYVDGELINSTETTGQVIEVTNSSYFGRKNLASYPTGNLLEVRVYPESKGEDWYTLERENFCGGLYEISEDQSSIEA